MFTWDIPSVKDWFVIVYSFRNVPTNNKGYNTFGGILYFLLLIRHVMIERLPAKQMPGREDAIRSSGLDGHAHTLDSLNPWEICSWPNPH